MPALLTRTSIGAARIAQTRVDGGKSRVVDEVGGERIGVDVVRAADLGCEGIETGTVAGDEHHVVAATGERQRERAPDPGRRPGDERGGH